MLIDYTLGQTSIILRVKLRQDTTGANPGNGITALTSASTGLIISTIADDEATPTTYTQAGSTIETITTLGTYAAPTATKCRFKLVDNTNHPGIYEIQIADARFAVSSAKSLLISISGVSGMSNCDVTIPLRTVNPYDVNFALQGLKGTTNPTAGALITAGTGMAQLSVSGGVGQADAAKINGVATTSVTTVGANMGTTQPINFSGTGASALVKGDAEQLNGQTVSASGTITFPNATIASTTNITAGTITTTTNLTNLPSIPNNWLTAAGIAASALNGKGDWALAATALSTAQWTSARAGYIDNLNVGGAVASHADIAAINQSASKHLLLTTVGQYEPDETYTVEMRTYDALTGSAVNADTTPTLTATGMVSGDLSANLSAATNPATGVYRWTYTPGSTPTLEQIRFDGSATITTVTYTLSAYAQTVDFATAVFTVTDQMHLTSIYNKLPVNDIADETLVLAAVGSPVQASGTITTLDGLASHGDSTWSTAVGFAVPGDQMDLVNAPNATAVAAIQAGLATPTNITAGTITTVGSIAAGGITRASFDPDTGLQTVRSDTAQAGGATSITLDASASSADGYYANDIIYLTGGTGAGQARFCTAYDGTTKVATVAAWSVVPDNTTTFAVLPFDSIPGATAPTAAENAAAVWQDLLAGGDFNVAGSIGLLLATDIDDTISGRAPAATALSTAQWTNSLATNLGTLAGHDPGSTLAAASDVSGAVTSIESYGAIHWVTATGFAVPGDVMQQDMTQAVPTSNTAQTVGDALNAARAQGFGKWTLVGTTLTLYAANGTTVVRTFTLDSATAPTSRT